jgi:hypothetical protein
MTSWTSIALIALAGIPGARVQEKAQGSAPDAKPAAGSRADRLAAIEKEYDDARRAFSKAYQEAKTPEERQQLQYPNAKTWAPKVWDVVHENPADETGFEGLSWIVQRNPSKQDLEQAVDALLQGHVKNPKIGQLCPSLAGMIQIDSRLLTRIATENPDRNAKGQAYYALAGYALECASTSRSIKAASEDEAKEMKEYLGEQRYQAYKVRDPEDIEREAGKALDIVVAQYADVPDVSRGGRSTLGEAAKGDLHELRDLVVGKPAPDIEGEDLNGASFKLSQYRGKVVLLDFWGNW